MNQLLRTLTLLLSLGLAAGAGAANLKPGHDYELVSPPQPTSAKGKVEVIEFFSYACPHCAHFEPLLEPWVKKLPKDVVFRRIPVIFRPQWKPLARLYLTLEAMGEADRLQTAAFDAVQNHNVLTDEAITAWAKSQGVDEKRFVDMYRSFSVESQLARSQEQLAGYGVRGVPTLIVAGKYRNPSRDEMNPDAPILSPEEILKLTDALIVKARAEQK
jgi:thiol:disulfide interchange protein DsbA